MRGVFERPIGSGIWWINYYANGKRHREKVGRESDAKTLYGIRKADTVRGIKLPSLRRVTFGALIDDALEYAKSHNADVRNYVNKAAFVRKGIGSLSAENITPQEISRWLDRHCKTPATSNRYKSFISLCFREGIANGKVTSNPARLVRQKRESAGRLRFLSRDEAQRIHDSLPVDRRPAFLLALHTGMRLSEQFTLKWKQVKRDRKVIELGKTKNGTARTIPLNSVAWGAIEALYTGQKPTESVFQMERKTPDVRPWFPAACVAAEVDGFTWHGLRHTFCSWLALAGESLKTIQELAGHKTIGMSSRYAHLTADHKSTAIERITQGGGKVLQFEKAG